MKSVSWTKGAFAVLLVSYMFVSPVRAAEQHFYAEIDIGRSNVTDESVSIDEYATGFRLTAGYQLIPWLAVDIGYVDFGTFETSFIDIIGPPVPVEASADGLELGLVGRVPLGDSFAILGHAEMLWWDSNAVVNGASDRDSGNDFAYGLGVEMALNNRFVVTGDWRKYAVAETDVDMLTLGFQLRFGGSASK